MRILIIGIPRSGTTSVYKSIKTQQFEMHSFFEPWIFGEEKLMDVYLYDRLLVKTMIYHKPGMKRTGKLLDDEIVDKAFNFYKTIIPQFDKIILLSRRNLEDASISYDYAKDNNAWSESYSTNQLPSTKTLNMYKLITNSIERLSTELNLKIWYYEDLFNVNNLDNILHFINYNNLEVKNNYKFFEYYNIKNKLRNNGIS